MVDDEDEQLVIGRGWHLINGYAVTRIPHPQGGTHPNGYARRTSYSMARMIMGLEWGDPRQVDHRNRIRLDNQRSNLRLSDNALNAQNRSPHRGATSQYRGVSWFAPMGRWVAYATLDGHRHHLGYHHTEEAAAATVQTWRAQHMPFSEEVL